MNNPPGVMREYILERTRTKKGRRGLVVNFKLIYIYLVISLTLMDLHRNKNAWGYSACLKKKNATISNYNSAWRRRMSKKTNENKPCCCLFDWWSFECDRYKFWERHNNNCGLFKITPLVVELLWFEKCSRINRIMWSDVHNKAFWCQNRTKSYSAVTG